MNYNLLKVFIKVAELGSFTKAAHQLKQPKSRVSRSILRLEEDLKTELIQRTTRSISLTESGRKLYQETQSLINKLEETVEIFKDDSEEITGILSISAPIDFGEEILPQIFCEFNQLYPGITFKVLLSDSFIDLVAHDIDITFRAGKLKDSNLKQKKIGEAQFVLVASSDYLTLNGVPRTWKDISNLNILSYWNENQQDPLDQMYQQYGFSPLIRTNSFPMLKKLALESKGIALIPSTLCSKELKDGRLIRVIPSWGHKKNPIQLVFSGSKNLPKKTRAFIEFVSEKKDFFI